MSHFLDMATLDRADYKEFLREFNFTEGFVRMASEFADDQVAMPDDVNSVHVGQSPVEGSGVFASRRIDRGEAFAPALMGGLRTPVGRYTNHAAVPNAFFLAVGPDDFVAVAAHRIDEGEEVTVNYRQAVGARRQWFAAPSAPDFFPIVEAPDPPEVAARKIVAFADWAKSMPQESTAPNREWFPAGLYVRESVVPAGWKAVTLVHKTEHITVILYGRALVYGVDGYSRELRGGDVFVTPKGTQRVIYAYEDTSFLTTHAAESRTREDAEHEVFARDMDDYLAWQSQILRACA